MVYFNIATAMAILSPLTVVTMAGKVTNPNRVPRNAILLSEVPTLTLRDGKKTAARRVGAVPQLICTGPKDVCKLYTVDVMRCVNEGADYDAANAQWSCKANLPDEFKLGSTDVVCEGYESSDDPYVLKGSCGVEYRLLLTDKGEQKYRRSATQSDQSGADSTPSWVTFVFWAIFLGVVFVILKAAFWPSQGNQRPGGTRRTGGGGGGGGNGDDPPPPYDDPPSYYRSQPPKPKTRTATASPWGSTFSQASSSRSTQPQQPQQPQQQGWRPGFWTGTATGAAAGYAMGNRTRTEAQQQGGGLFSNFMGGGQQQRPAPPPPPPARSSSDYSSTRYDSTGFGETRRR